MSQEDNRASADNKLGEGTTDGNANRHGCPDQTGASTGGARPVVVEHDMIRIAVEVGQKRPGPLDYSSDAYVCRIELPVRAGNLEDLRVMINTLFAEAERMVDVQLAKKRAARRAEGQP